MSKYRIILTENKNISFILIEINISLYQEMQLKKRFEEEALNKPERDSDGKTLKQVKQRNQQMIKEMEMSRAKMRSMALYSPLETILQNAIKNYIKSISKTNDFITNKWNKLNGISEKIHIAQ